MQLYALVHNNQIRVGPRGWNRSFFLDYLTKQKLDSSVLPKKAPTESTITADWKLLLITEVTFPDWQQPFEQLVGPFWTIHETHITGVYDKTDVPVHAVQGSLKNTVAANRYAVETGKLEYTFPDGQVVSLYTEREERMIYLNTLSALPDGMTVPFKFRDGVFRTGVTKTELQQIVAAGMMHIASAFEWEAAKVAEIETADTVETLRLIELRHPAQILEEETNGSRPNEL
jgi:hypothetical protein